MAATAGSKTPRRTTTPARKPPAARQTAGRPAQVPSVTPSQAGVVKSLGDPRLQGSTGDQLAALQGQVRRGDPADIQAQLADLQRQLAELTQGTPPAPPPRHAEIAAPADPDVLGLPGVKPLRLVTSSEPESRHPLVYIDGEPITVPDELSRERHPRIHAPRRWRHRNGPAHGAGLPAQRRARRGRV